MKRRKYLWAGYRRKSLNIGVQYSYNKNPPQFPFNFVGKGKKLKLFLCIRNSRFRKYSLDSIHGHSSCLHICRTRNVKRGFKSDLLSVNWWVLCVSRNLWRKSIWSALYSAPSPGMDVRVQCNLRENGTSTISTFNYYAQRLHSRVVKCEFLVVLASLKQGRPIIVHVLCIWALPKLRLDPPALNQALRGWAFRDQFEKICKITVLVVNKYPKPSGQAFRPPKKQGNVHSNFWSHIALFWEKTCNAIVFFGNSNSQFLVPALVKVGGGVGLGQNIHDYIFDGFENEFLRNIRICFWTGALPRAKFLQFGHFSLNKALAAFEWCQILNPIFLQTQNWTQRTILEIFPSFFFGFWSWVNDVFSWYIHFPSKEFF